MLWTTALSHASWNADNRHEMLFQLCKTLVRQSDADWATAVQSCSDAADINPLDSVTLTSIAIGASTTSVVSVAPYCATPALMHRVGCGAAYKGMGDTTRERAALERALAINPNAPSSRRRLAQLEREL